MILFSTISSNFERTLKEELYACFKFIGIPFSELYKMPVRDRKFYIKEFIEEQERLKENTKV